MTELILLLVIILILLPTGKLLNWLTSRGIEFLHDRDDLARMGVQKWETRPTPPILRMLTFVQRHVYPIQMLTLLLILGVVAILGSF